MPDSCAPILFSRLLRTIVIAILCLPVAHAQDNSAGGARNLSVAQAGKRLALVIGNDAYQNVSRLEKAGNDATAMARELKAAGFEVLLHRDLNYRGMVKAVETLAGSITGGDQVVVFFAGHGVQIKSGSYLLPIDIEASSESEVEKTAYGLNDLTEKLADAKASFTLVMVDACRDNPLKSRGRSVGSTRGLSAIEPPKGQMVVYSASKGQQALDRLNETDSNPNGIYTREFIKRMKQPGVKIEDLVREVQESVETLARSVSHEQRPAIYNEARGNFYFFGPSTVQALPGERGTAAKVRIQSAEEIEQDLWQSIKDTRDAGVFEEYLRQYSKGRYAGQARVMISKLKAEAHSLAANPVASKPAPTIIEDPDTALWKAVEQGGSADEYAVYLKQYPKGKYAALAKQRQQKLKAEGSASDKTKDIQKMAMVSPAQDKSRETAGEVDKYFAMLARDVLQEASSFFQNSVTAKPDDVNIRAGLAVAMILKGDEETARYNVRRIKEIGRETRWTRIAIGLSDGLGQDYEGGKYQLNRAIEDGADKALAYLALALIHDKNGKGELAEKGLETYKSLVPVEEQGRVPKELAVRTNIGTRLIGSYYLTGEDRVIPKLPMVVVFSKRGDKVLAEMPSMDYGPFVQHMTVSNLNVENGILSFVYRAQAKEFWNETQVSAELKGNLREIPILQKQIAGNTGSAGTTSNLFLIRKD